MAYINVAEWCPDQVTDWLKGMTNNNDAQFFASIFKLRILFSSYRFLVVIRTFFSDKYEYPKYYIMQYI